MVGAWPTHRWASVIGRLPYFRTGCWDERVRKCGSSFFFSPFFFRTRLRKLRRCICARRSHASHTDRSVYSHYGTSTKFTDHNHVRLMKLKSLICYSWHVYRSSRIESITLVAQLNLATRKNPYVKNGPKRHWKQQPLKAVLCEWQSVCDGLVPHVLRQTASGVSYLEVSVRLVVWERRRAAAEVWWQAGRDMVCRSGFSSPAEGNTGSRQARTGTGGLRRRGAGKGPGQVSDVMSWG